MLTAFILCKNKTLWERIYGRIAETGGDGKNPGGAKFSRPSEGYRCPSFRYMTNAIANDGMMAVLVYYRLSKKLAIGMGFREKQ